MRAPLLCLLIAACGRGRQSEQAAAPALTLDSEACRTCHAAIVDSYLQTAHFATSTVADSSTIKGSFVAPANEMRTGVPAVAFRMEKRGDGLYQTAIDARTLRAHSERFDLVVGSGRRGQTYLYWKGGILYQLPLSWLATYDGWINSPGYRDGEIDFSRVIQPRCLECHSTRFALESDSASQQLRYSQKYRLGLTCEKCHGDARRHVEYHTRQPGESAGKFIYASARHPRDQKVEACAVCHSGVLQPLRPAFSYAPGDPLNQYFVPDSSPRTGAPDVHGNQVGLLRASACYRNSPELSCATCHDVHQEERNLTGFADKCLGCHQVERHRGSWSREQLVTRCIDCHMPTSPSAGLQINTAKGPFAITFRTHRIAVYR